MRTRRLLMMLALTFAGCVALASGVRMSHTVTLKPGWNAFFLPITLTRSASDVFADWPVERVGFYDQTAFLQTKQFSTGASDSTFGAIDAGMKMWVRGDVGHTSFDTLAANGVYVTVNTNKAQFVVTLRGEPAAYRVSWHVSDGVSRPLNYAGVSCVSSASLTADGYLRGLDTGWTSRWSVYGLPTATVPGLQDLAKSPVLNNGSVFAMDADKVSDWSGVLNVSPVSGVSLGTNLNVAVMSVRNDAATNRVVRVSFRQEDGQGDGTRLAMPTVMYLDPAVHNAWQPSLAANPHVRELKAGETLKLRLAIDRETQCQSPTAGTEYGGILDIVDTTPDGPSGFKTSVPFSVQSDGGAFRRTKWPKGLWVASVTLDKVSRLDSNKDVSDGPIPVSAQMKVRLLVHVDAVGQVRLLQRAWLGARRLSAPVLPTDLSDPEYPAIHALPVDGTFGGAVTSHWVVAETSNVNPFRHAKHPDHDGKSADFKQAAPSGDDLDNYLQTVKPELFSIVNDLHLDWAETRAAAWSPEETLSGACTWSLDGLRHEGPIKMCGAFTMQRVSDAELSDVLD